MRTLSDKGVHLYLDATAQPVRPKKWYRYLICSVFHSDYDDRLADVLINSRKSTQALCALFGVEGLSERLDAGVYNTVKLIRGQESDFNFFADVMWSAFQQDDHQTAHMLYLTLNDRRLKHIKVTKRVKRYLESMLSVYGAPVYEKHIHYWRTVRSDNILPSVIAFHNFVKRRQFMRRNYEAQEAIEFMDIFKFLEHSPRDILPVYNKY
jgi:hypothetical protein|tara:strand:+ start:421 stop:1047 length:627 start_codon:yes stop_codon:yes gene_type:complete